MKIPSRAVVLGTMLFGLAGVLRAQPVSPTVHPSMSVPVQSIDARASYVQLMERARQDGQVRVIVTLRTPATANKLATPRARAEALQEARRHVLADLAPHAARPGRTFTQFPLLALDVDAGGLAQLRASAWVDGIQEDVPYDLLLSESVHTIGADSAWVLGGSGIGQAVAVLDTGVDTEHPFLAGKVVAEACFSTSYQHTAGSYRSVTSCPNGLQEQYTAGAGKNCDAEITGCDHGTRVAGIVAGHGEEFSGVARDAKLIAIQVFSVFEDYCGEVPCVRSWVSDQLAALEYVYTLRDQHQIAAVNFSLGGGHYTSEAGCDTVNPAMKAAIDQLHDAGIAVVAAAGNSGQVDGLVAPACISSAVSVGATAKQEAIVSGFSSSAPFLKLLAPGQSILSSVPGGDFRRGSGTSFSAPHVAGAWAILRARTPYGSIEEILQTLTETGMPIEDERNGVTRPRIRVDAALDATGLPVELVSFDGRSSNRSVVLTWETASEVNNAGFRVEQLIQHQYEPVGYVTGHGTTTEAHTYSYTVMNLTPGRHRFRLRQIDFDGAYAFGPEVDVLVSFDGSHFLGAAYPNPFNPRTRFSLTVAVAQDVRIDVYDLVGRRVAQLHNGLLDAERVHEFELEGGHLASGLYLIQVRGESFQASRSIMLLK